MSTIEASIHSETTSKIFFINKFTNCGAESTLGQRKWSFKGPNQQVQRALTTKRRRGQRFETETLRAIKPSYADR